MLVLARRPNEQIVINGEIFITVLETGRGGQVRLGITAPPHVQIYRHELWVEIQAENRNASLLTDAKAVADLDRLLAGPATPVPAEGRDKTT
jgi:carbon storage regulator